MGIVALKIKLMPSGLDVKLDNIEKEAKKIMDSLGSKNTTFVQEPIAFGLKSLILQTAWPEEKTVDDAEIKLSKISGVSSVEVIDYRRAFG